MNAMTISNAMNSKRFDSFKKAGLCLVAASLFLSPCSGIGMESQAVAPSGKTNPMISLHNERLNIKAESVSLQQLLDNIAKTCDLRIISTSAIKPGTVVDVDKTDWKVGEALADLLKGNNYLVVYNEAPENTGLFELAERLTSVASSYVPFAPQSGNKVEPQQADYLRGQIKMLSERIASGASDRTYEAAIKRKGPSYVKHDRELLVGYEKRLSRLEDGKS